VAVKQSAFIVNVESDEADEQLLQRLERAGLVVDREYGLVRLDVRGRKRVARVVATEQKLEEAQAELRVTFYPDLTIVRPGSGEK
jgi:hypothetical protein